MNHYIRTSSPKTGAIPCCTRPDRLDIMWPESNLSLAVDMWDAASKVPAPLASRLRTQAAKVDEIYLKLRHDFSPQGIGFVAGANVHTLEPLKEGPWTRTELWATAYGKSTDAQIALLCDLRYRQTKDNGYRALVLKAASRYLNTEPDLGITLYPVVMADAIQLMLKANELSGEQRYLARADHFARQAVAIFLDDTSPLPKVSSRLDHYEALTGGDNLMMALLSLWAVQNHREARISFVYNDR